MVLSVTGEISLMPGLTIYPLGLSLRPEKESHEGRHLDSSMSQGIWGSVPASILALSPQILGYDRMCSEEKVLMVLAVQSWRTQQSHLRQYRPLLIYEGKRHQAAPEEIMHPCACDLRWLLRWLVFE